MGGRVAAVILSAVIIMTTPAGFTTAMAAPKMSVELSKSAIKKTSVQALNTLAIVQDESVPEILEDAAGITDNGPGDVISSETEEITIPDESPADIPSDSSDVPTETESTITVPDDDISVPDLPDDFPGTDESLPDGSSGIDNAVSDESTDESLPDDISDESPPGKMDESFPEKKTEQGANRQDEPSTDSTATPPGTTANGAEQNETAAGRTSERVITIPSSNSGSTALQSDTQASAASRRRVEKKVQEYTLTDKVAMTTVEKVKELNVSTGKGTNYSTAGRIRKGGIVFLLSSNKDGEWVFIETEDAGHHVLRGYVKSEFLTDKNAETRHK